MRYFQPNCTLPTEVTNYVASPNIRSTLDILWSSLATIVACTWSVLHLNVPEQRQGRDHSWKGDIKWASKRFWSKLEWCIFTILLPEFILIKAIGDWRNVRRQLRMLHDSCESTRKTINVTHMIFADMGGFVLSYPRAPPSLTVRPAADPVSSNVEASADTQVHCRDERGDSRNDIEAGRNSEEQHGRPPAQNQSLRTEREINDELWHLDAYVLRRLVEVGHVSPALPSSAEITDKSKSDALAKIIILGQIGYFVLAVLVRVCKNFPICSLELGTVAFVACSTVTYAANFQKPSGPEEAIILRFEDAASVMAEFRRLAEFSPKGIPWGGRQRLGRPIANNNSGFYHDGDAILSVLVICALFSSIHLAGWNLHFPSSVDMWLWRSSALASTVAPLLVILPIVVVWLLNKFFAFDTASYGVSTFAIGCIVYLMARLVILVEMFRGLAFLPPDAFVATWTGNIPHVG